MANILLPKHFANGIVLEPVSADPANPIIGQQQFSDGTARAAGLWTYNGTNWVTPSKLLTIEEESTTGTIAATTDIELITCTSDLTRTLPDAAGYAGKTLQLKADSVTLGEIITISRAGSDTIEGLTSTTLNTTGETIYLSPVGTDWKILNRKTISETYTYSLGITATTTDPVKGTNTELATWQRRGDKIIINYSLNQTSAGTAGSGLYRFSMPTGVTADTSKYLAATDLGNNTVGKFTYRTTGGVFHGNCRLATSSLLAGNIGDTSAATLEVASGYGGLGGATVRYSFNAEFTVQGWNS